MWLLRSKFELGEVLFDLGLEHRELFGWDELVSNLHNSRDLVLHLLHLDLLAHALDLCLHAGLECGDLVADLGFLGLLGVRARKLSLELRDAVLGMFAVVSDGSGFAAALLSADFSLQVFFEAFNDGFIAFCDVVGL